MADYLLVRSPGFGYALAMRLKEYQVRLSCQKLLHGLRAKQLIVLKKSEGECQKKMEELFIKELRAEEEINREAEKLLAQYETRSGGELDRQKMFQLIKRQLAKDRGFIL